MWRQVPQVVAPWWRMPALMVGIFLFLPRPAHSQAIELEPGKWPLSSIGRVNVVLGVDRRRQCTGTLIGPRHVLTAAHCLFNPIRSRWVHPTSVHFVAGYERGEYKAHSEAASYETGSGFVFSDPPQPRPASHDWAIIKLAQRMELKPVNVDLRSEGVAAQLDVVRAGYRGDRAHVLTIQRDCSVRAISSPAALLLHSCGSVSGESGSALLRVGSGDPEIIGVLVAHSKKEGASSSIAVPATTFADAVERALKP